MKLKIRFPKTAIYGAGILLLLFALWSGLRPVPVPAYSVVKQDYVPSLLLSGEVIAEGSTLLSSPISGKVLDCLADKGEKVHKGQLLVQIDDAQARVERDRAAEAVKLANSQLQKASTVTREEVWAKSVQADLALEEAEQEYARLKVLAEAGAVSKAELEQAERQQKLARQLALSARAALDSFSAEGSSLAILQAELRQRQLDLAEKELQLKQYQILAPADGLLLDLYVLPGELLSVGSQVALLAAGEGLRIKIQPDQRYAELAVLGNKAEAWITNDATTKWPAQVVYREPSGNAEQGSFTAELGFSQAAPPLYPGQLLTVQLFGPAQTEAIILPDRFLTVEMGQNGVWLAKDGRAVFTPLQIGLRTKDGVVITEGLEPGDLVLSPAGLRDNKRVAPRPGAV